MKTKTIIRTTLKKAFLLFVPVIMTAKSETNSFEQKMPESYINTEITAKLTKYEVKSGFEKQFQKVLNDYVRTAIANKDNIMAESYVEKDKPTVFWLLERWINNQTLKSAEAKTLLSLEKTMLIESPKQFVLKDLEPLTKEQWRRMSKKEDNQLIVILFVNAKKGTEANFKTTYHKAMPKFRSEPGVVTYQLSEIEGDGTQFVTYEKFRSEDAFQYHLKFPPIQPVIEYLETSIINPPFQNGLHNLMELAPLTRE